MSYIARQPTGRLLGIVDRVWRVEDAHPSFAPETICPDGRTEIILHLGDPMLQLVNGARHSQPRHLLVAQMDGPVKIVPTGRVRMVGARFVTGALHRVLPMPQDRLAGKILDLEAVWQRWARRAAEQVEPAASPEAELDVFEQALVELVSNDVCADRDAAVDAAIARLRMTGGQASIERLAHDAAMSRRQFERRFREHVGLPPRLFGRIVKFQRAFQALGLESGATIAARCGYADQAHLVREIRRFAGQTPTVLAEAEGLTAFFRG